MDLNDERMIREDTLHVGATRPVRFLGLPMPLAVALVGLAYVIQTNVTGWQGVLWAVSVVGPCWGIAYLAVAHDPYGINVGLAWLRTSLLSLDRGAGAGRVAARCPHACGRRRRHGP